MSKVAFKKILEHPDKDEIISKLASNTTAKDVCEWLKVKYSDIDSNKFIISEINLKKFQDTYLDVYKFIQQDIIKTNLSIANNTEDELALSVQNNSIYKNRMLELAGKEFDIRETIVRLCYNIEDRLAQVFDEIQRNPNINIKTDTVLIEYAKVLGDILEKYHKFTEMPANMQLVQNNVTLNVMDKHVSTILEAIKEVLANMDVESSLYFMELFNDKMSKLNPKQDNTLNTDTKFAEVQLLNQSINNRIN